MGAVPSLLPSWIMTHDGPILNGGHEEMPWSLRTPLSGKTSWGGIFRRDLDLLTGETILGARRVWPKTGIRTLFALPDTRANLRRTGKDGDYGVT